METVTDVPCIDFFLQFESTNDTQKKNAHNDILIQRYDNCKYTCANFYTKIDFFSFFYDFGMRNSSNENWLEKFFAENTYRRLIF